MGHDMMYAIARMADGRTIVLAKARLEAMEAHLGKLQVVVELPGEYGRAGLH